MKFKQQHKKLSVTLFEMCGCLQTMNNNSKTVKNVINVVKGVVSEARS